MSRYSNSRRSTSPASSAVPARSAASLNASLLVDRDRAVDLVGRGRMLVTGNAQSLARCDAEAEDDAIAPPLVETAGIVVLAA
jgi:hypothetical protein